jgi:hypothetical protein
MRNDPESVAARRRRWWQIKLALAIAGVVLLAWALVLF